MKYDKGSFIIVPNKHLLSGQHPITQAVFMWICSYADELGECWPSRARLASDVAVSLPSVDKAIDTLCELGILTKQVRPIQKNRNLPNLYHINVIGRVGQPDLPRVGHDVYPVGQGGLQELYPIELKDTEASASEILEVPIEDTDAPRKNEDPYKVNYEELCDWAESQRGFKFVSRVKQYAALKRARLQEIAPSRLQKRWKELSNEDFYIENGLDWGMVVSSFDKRA